jgi:hypothetical protein
VVEDLSTLQVKTLIENTIDAFPHEECATCECFLGYVTQLELVSDEGSKQFLNRHKPRRMEVHACLGCDPCPPGDHFAAYLRDNSS